ncbi:IclR family transcriptional regulator [Mycobacterium sp. 1245805.9]|uniref:IclR family transcriptional regulator n=1 Tax=Mycobacterium sp. 1245805.9 TaxID=1856862 RepID=UPI0009EE1112|nr:helix-turn-helix domain-containing protein [Mycobacterium sp. 1245805.9]
MSEERKTQSPPTSRALAVLEALTKAPIGGLSLSEVARAVGLSTSTTAAILATMDDAGYVERLPDKGYRLGSGPLKLVGALRVRYPLLGAADPELSRLSALTGGGSTLTQINDNDLEVILTAGRVEEFVTRIGHRLPLYPPYGTVPMAWSSPKRVNEWLFSAPDPMTAEEIEAQRDTLAGVKERGYAVYNIKQDVRSMVEQIRDLLTSADEHAPSDVLRRLQVGAVTGIGIYSTAELADRRRRPVSYVMAPVFGPDQQPRYLVALHVMADALPAGDLDNYIEAILQTAKTLTRAAGGRWPKSGR